jgi:hypothetical protein
MPASIAHMVIAHKALANLEESEFKELAKFAGCWMMSAGERTFGPI